MASTTVLVRIIHVYPSTFLSVCLSVCLSVSLLVSSLLGSATMSVRKKHARLFVCLWIRPQPMLSRLFSRFCRSLHNYPWTYDRGEGPGLELCGRQDPWDPNSRSVVPDRRTRLERAIRGSVPPIKVPDNNDRVRRAFKLMMVGLDGGGKSSILFALKADQVRLKP